MRMAIFLTKRNRKVAVCPGNTAVSEGVDGSTQLLIACEGANISWDTVATFDEAVAELDEALATTASPFMESLPDIYSDDELSDLRAKIQFIASSCRAVHCFKPGNPASNHLARVILDRIDEPSAAGDD